MMIPRLAILAAALALSACTAVRPLDSATPALTADFHSNLDSVMRNFVDARGRVDYGALARDRTQLERYFALVAAYSPDSHPHLFATSNQALAYWINAYNGAVLAAVTRNYPIRGVGDVGWSLMKIGFFVQQQFTFGGATMNLYDLEHKVIRDRFRDPRIHFAINCASVGCPRLPQHAFRASDLDARLDEETRRFFAEERNVRIDHAARTVHLSAILDWYADDFLVWPEHRLPDEPVLVDYIALYSAAARRAELERARSYEVHFNAYDWSLNDRR